MTTRTLQFGNLAAEFQTTAKSYEKASDIKPAAEGSRNVIVRYRQTKAMTAKGITAPQSFTFQIPAFPAAALIDMVVWKEKGHEFVAALIEEYQDSVATKCIDKEVTFQPTDWPRIIADYFETGRGGITQKSMREWIDDVFEPAFVLRQVELNQTAAADGRIAKSDSDIEKLCKGYIGYLTQLTQRQCMLPHSYVKTLHQTLTRLQELELIPRDEVADEFLDRMETILSTTEQTLESIV